MSELNWPLNVPVLTDGHVTLRAHVASDVDRVLEMAQDEQMVAWTVVGPDQTRADSERFIFETIPAGWDDDSKKCWAIEFNGHFAGNVDLRGSGPLAEVAFALHPDCRGQSVMSAAVRLVLDNAFVSAGVEAVTWRARVGNEASLQVAHACGFRLHELVPDALCESGQIFDAWTGSIRFGEAPYPRTRWARSSLRTERFVLRPPKLQDLLRWVEAENNPQSMHWSGGTRHTIQTAVADYHRSVWRAAKGERISWTIADPQTDAFLGQVMIGDLTGLAEVGYTAHPDARGNGMIAEAVLAVSDYGLDPEGLNLARLELRVAAGNLASEAIARKCGYRQYGLASRAEPLGDQTSADLLCFELVR